MLPHTCFSENQCKIFNHIQARQEVDAVWRINSQRWNCTISFKLLRLTHKVRELLIVFLNLQSRLWSWGKKTIGGKKNQQQSKFLLWLHTFSSAVLGNCCVKWAWARVTAAVWPRQRLLTELSDQHPAGTFALPKLLKETDKNVPSVSKWNVSMPAVLRKNFLTRRRENYWFLCCYSSILPSGLSRM